jgi:hypothetical protein
VFTVRLPLAPHPPWYSRAADRHSASRSAPTLPLRGRKNLELAIEDVLFQAAGDRSKQRNPGEVTTTARCPVPRRATYFTPLRLAFVLALDVGVALRLVLVFVVGVGIVVCLIS